MNFKINFLFFLCLLRIGVYGLIISGWSSNSSYSILGSLRSVAQSISYEVTFRISILIILIIINIINLNNLIYFQKYLYIIFFFYPISLILFIRIIAELNRTPFDLSEGESELVSGFNIEYRRGKFILIFLSEYSRILFLIFLFTLIFICSNIFSVTFYLLIILILFFIVWLRITLPRIRYDVLIYFCWFFILPIILNLFILFILFFKFPINLLLIN